MRHFLTLDQAQQADAIRRLHAAGQSELTIAAATRLSLEQIRSVLAFDHSMAMPYLGPRPADSRLRHCREHKGKGFGKSSDLAVDRVSPSSMATPHLLPDDARAGHARCRGTFPAGAALPPPQLRKPEKDLTHGF